MTRRAQDEAQRLFKALALARRLVVEPITELTVYERRAIVRRESLVARLSVARRQDNHRLALKLERQIANLARRTP